MDTRSFSLNHVSNAKTSKLNMSWQINWSMISFYTSSIQVHNLELFRFVSKSAVKRLNFKTLVLVYITFHASYVRALGRQVYRPCRLMVKRSNELRGPISCVISDSGGPTSQQIQRVPEGDEGSKRVKRSNEQFRRSNEHSAGYLAVTVLCSGTSVNLWPVRVYECVCLPRVHILLLSSSFFFH